MTSSWSLFIQHFCYFYSLAARNTESFSSPYLSGSGKLWPQFISSHHQYKSPFTFLVLWSHFTFTFRSPSPLYASTILFCYSSWIRPFYGTTTRPCRNMLQLLCASYISDLIKDELLYASSECICCLDFYSACTKSPRPYAHLYFSFEENRATFWKIN